MKKFLTGLMAVGLLFGTLSASNALTQFAVLNPEPGGPQTPYFFDNASMTFGVTPTPLEVQFQFITGSSRRRNEFR